MKNLVIAVCMLSIVFLTGCSDDSKSGKSITTRGRGSRGTPTVSNTPDRNGQGVFVENREDFLPQGKALTGEIYERQNYLVNFRNNLYEFVSSFMDPSDMGDVEGSFGANTGVVFGGFIEFEGINFSPGMTLSSSTQIRESSAEVRISIFDDLVGTSYIDDAGKERIYTEIPVDFVPGELVNYKIIDGNQMYFIFEDVYGFVAFSTMPFFNNEGWSGGFYSDNGQAIFGGAVYYQNKASYDSSETVDYNAQNWRALGFFAVPACGFFRCGAQ